MKSYIILLGVMLVVLQACNQSAKKTEKYAVVNLDSDDKVFLALKDTAQAHINEFTDSLMRHYSDKENYEFIVKSDFSEGKTHEHMWSEVHLLKNDSLTGVLIDSPFNIKNIKTNDEVRIKLNDVEDWSVYDKVHNRRIGGYSDKYLESKQ